MFKKHKYEIVKQAISKDLALYLYNYFRIKKQVYDTFLQHKYISPYEQTSGCYEGVDAQIPNTYSHYSDIAMETLMLKCQPQMEKTTGLKLYPSYTYARIYKKGDELHRHKDRFSCEISTTMNLGGDDWPLFLDPTGETGIESGHDQSVKLKKNANKGVKVNLKPGDMLVYRGCDLEHWRDKFKGTECVQVFLHYNNCKTPGAKENIFDSRKHVGLPAWFKGVK
jgi:hypothetical protein|tara:strand:+ start:280 stop:951 length:672 start_codon:yes stop_codon:yes gene_type:complete